MRVLITGANGFIGRILKLHLSSRKGVQVTCFTRQHSISQLPMMLEGTKFVFHLAGVNRPLRVHEFHSSNVLLTQALCDAITSVAVRGGRKIPVLYTSSTQAARDTPYGNSKRIAEQRVSSLTDINGVPTHIFRLPNLFGKWGVPNYNSVINTFCYNVAHNLPIHINDPDAKLTLAYVDDVVDRFIKLMDGADAQTDANGFEIVTPQYTTTVGEVAHIIQSFQRGRRTQESERVGTGLMRALYATYISYLPAEAFVYSVPLYRDKRGVFAEMLRTPDCGQLSYFTAYPGVTRGGHYHHTKTEKFLVVKGHARFRFRNILTGESYEVVTNGEEARVVETAPGWTHDITNIGTEKMIVMLWANEVFDQQHPDTFACPI